MAEHAGRPNYHGDGIGRACRLHLAVDEAERIFVASRVIDPGRGAAPI